MLQAGDTVLIMNGTYQIDTHPSNKEINPVNSGNAVDGYISFEAYPGHAPVLDGGNNMLPNGGLITIANRDYIRVSGLTVQNVDDDDEGIGIYVENSRNIVIENNHVRHIDSSGIQVFSKDFRPGQPSANITITGNEVEDTNRGGPNEMITVSGVDGFEVAYNKVHSRHVGGGGGEGIDIKEGSQNGTVHHNEVWDLNTNRPGIYLDAWDQTTRNIDVYSNVVRDIDTFGIYIGSERGGLLDSINIYNNLVYDNRRAGIALADESSFSGTEPLHNINIFNNTIAYNGTDIGWYGSIYLENPFIDNLLVANNISYENGGFQISDIPVGATNVTIENNLLFGDLGSSDNLRLNANLDLFGDPDFLGKYDFNLSNLSAAIDAGDNSLLPADRFDLDGDTDLVEVVSQDFNDQERVQNSLVDLGAIEFQSGDGEVPASLPLPLWGLVLMSMYAMRRRGL